jgi:hypothetical protein
VINVSVEVREFDRGTLIVGPRGRYFCRFGRSGLLAAIADGRLTVDMSDAILKLYDKAGTAGEQVTAFTDATRVSAVDAALVEKASEWVKRRATPVMTHALVRSKLLELSVTMLNMVSRRSVAELYTDEARFLLAARREWIAFTMPTFPAEVTAQAAVK